MFGEMPEIFYINRLMFYEIVQKCSATYTEF